MESFRTTIVLEKELYRQVKRLALEQDKTLKEIIEQALRSYLRGDHEPRQKSRGGRFGVYAGKVRGSLRRENLYRDMLK
ncbi:MAG TPA: ribbon-helix-helix protein, CopG family [Candidatus Binatia bacterium]|jgi:metal-responsive CopG/Arc/MetJ family transcriptional regulator|nr:ribbon-helix-helix protein, CopG family [Candidatus Binatia bacterium]